MASISVRNLDNELVPRLKRRAVRHEQSAEAEVRDILRQILSAEPEGNFDEFAAQFRALLAGRHFTPSEDLIREGRDER
jgi:antitoxin FitA